MAADVSLEAGGADGGASLAKARRPAIHLGLFASLIAIAEIGSRAGLINPIILPAPSDIVTAFWRIAVTQGNLWPNLFVTLWEVFAGFLAGSALGIGLAILIGLSPLLTRFLKPYVIVIETTPRIALAPLIIAALGFGWASKITIIMLVCFFAPFVNTLSGIASCDPEKEAMFRSLRATRLQIFFRLILPEASPVILAGLRLAMASALSGALVAEFISANNGMGVMLKVYTGALNMSSAFATLLTLTLIGFLLFRGMEALDARLVFWRSPERMARIGDRRRARFLRAMEAAR